MGNEIGNLCFVTESPQQSIGCRVGLGFFSDLRDPLVALGVFHAVFRRVAARFLFDKSDSGDVGLHLLAAGA